LIQGQSEKNRKGMITEQKEGKGTERPGGGHARATVLSSLARGVRARAEGRVATRRVTHYSRAFESITNVFVEKMQ
jgi:hypothetical protein